MTTPSTSLPVDTKRLRELAEKATPGPWILATSNSWRRFVAQGMTPVCEPVTQNDGHPDLYFRNGGADGPDANLMAACDPDTVRALCDAADEARAALTAANAEIARLTAEVEALRVDAGRYRWLRDVSRGFHGSTPYVCIGFGDPQDGTIGGTDLDAAIDAARSKP